MRTARSAVVALGLLYVVFVLGTLVAGVLGDAPVDQVLLIVLSVGCAVVGALVAWRQPRNAVGWLLLTIAVTVAFMGASDAYLHRPGLPWARPVAWVSAWIWYVWLYTAGLFLPLFFPGGRLLSPRWRLAAWSAAVALTCSIVSVALMPGRLDSEAVHPVVNPVGVPSSLVGTLRVLGDVGGGLAAIGVLAGAVCLVLRLRRATGRERQQVALFVYVCALGLLALGMAIVGTYVTSLDEQHAPGWAVVVGDVGWYSTLGLLVVGVPVTVGVAILRHRLYDIDVVVKRTLVYGSLTAMLAATYLVVVLVLRVVLDPLTGTSDLAVAGSTLAVAGLFRPARRRVQHVVDRRFFRSSYDADDTVERFSGRLRADVDLDSISVDLRSVVRDTLAPTGVSLWLRSTR